ncbi:CAP family protein [Nonomuraea sp. NPDC050783]|uniref:CAP family protein n=1 Tax=Nonomuraea sp. NPDC050783 TaxID=3154634 RepID=UPI003467A5B0
MAGTRPPLPDATSDSFLSEALSEANAYRAKHHAPPLTLDSKLVEYAKSRASSRSEYEKLSAGHDGLRDETGENIFWGTSSGEPKTAADAVTSWYNEIADYNWDNPPGDFAKTGHFSQLVWKGSSRLGAARVAGRGSSGAYETYIVFVFETPGNYEGQYADNVLRA